MGRGGFLGVPEGASRRWQADLGPVEVLVNNAGITRDTTLPPHDPQQGNEVISTNLNSAVQHDPPGDRRHARAQASGGSSRSARSTARKGSTARPTTPPPRPATDRVHQRARPGERGKWLALTQFAGLHRHRHGAAVPEDVRNIKILPLIPPGRLGEPDEIARCVAFFARTRPAGSPARHLGEWRPVHGVSGRARAPRPGRARSPSRGVTMP